MDNYSSKICTKCYSVQEPHSRYCDNCGKMFTLRPAFDGNISLVTQSFLKRQVTQTRPLFWMGILIVATLAVFGFARSGVFRSTTPTVSDTETQAAVKLVSNEVMAQPRNTESLPVAPNDALDLNNSVFEMGTTGPHGVAPNKRRPVTTVTKVPIAASETKNEKTENAEPQPVGPPVKIVEKEVEKATEAASPAPKAYVRGPMGGCFYISASGSKRYVDRSLCN